LIASFAITSIALQNFTKFSILRNLIYFFPQLIPYLSATRATSKVLAPFQSKIFLADFSEKLSFDLPPVLSRARCFSILLSHRITLAIAVLPSPACVLTNP
jgi:hypothetical protein